MQETQFTFKINHINQHIHIILSTINDEYLL
jgi:phage baseplate assembly protein W